MNAIIGFARELDDHPDLPETFRYAWLEGTKGVKFGWRADVRDWKDPDTWPAGRLFGKTGEYRWQRGDGNKIHAVLILDEGTLPGDFNGHTDLKKDGEDSAMILWGEWVDPEIDPKANPDCGPRFYAGEIPEIQTYPIPSEQAQDKSKTPRLMVRRYRHVKKEAEEEKGKFVRCLGLDMKGEEKEAKNAEN